MNTVSINYQPSVNNVPCYDKNGFSKAANSKETDLVDPFVSSEGLTMKNVIDDLVGRVQGMERQHIKYEILLGKKMCPTRHGCTGATNCNYDYASYPG